MVKPAITALLALLCLFLFKANFDTFRTAPAPQENEVEPLKKTRAKTRDRTPPLSLNPTLRGPLTNLNTGYLFNAERALARDSRASKTGKGYGNNIRIEDVVFSGAILSAGYSKAIVSYHSGSSARPSVQTKRTLSKTQTAKSTTIQLEVGDQLGGYKVKEITSDFILFAKGSETIKKSLFDADKKRQQQAPRKATQPVPQPVTPSVAPPRRPTPRSVKKP